MKRGMIILILVQVSFILISPEPKTCSSNCWFVLNDPTGDESRGKDFRIPIESPHIVTGIITIDAHFTMEKDILKHDILKFVKIEHPFTEFAHPLEIQISAKGDLNQVVAFGVSTFLDLGKAYNGPTLFANKYGPVTPIFVDFNIDIQISDLNITQDNYYKFYIGTPGDSEVWTFNYGSQSMWQRYSDRRLNSTVRIENNDENNLTTYDSISVCSTPRPTLCDIDNIINIDAVLGASYTLTCSGSGAPHLTSEWSKNTYRETNETHLEICDNSTADNYIVSTLEISPFTINHIGIWKCRIFNKNFKDSVQKQYVFRYTKDIELMIPPKGDVYDNSNESKKSSLTWVVEGWPFDTVKLECNEDYGVQIDKDTSHFYTRTPPRLSIILAFTGTTADHINCVLRHDDVILDTVNITRVGYKCSAGEYGVGKHCYVCPQGQTSQEGSTRCYSSSNICHKDQYGVGEDCRNCPFGTVTMNLAVKKQDCRNVSYAYRSMCDPGEYGLDGRCDTCLGGMTSEKGAVKAYECFPAISYCESGYWGIGNDCSACPANKTSARGNAVKVQDCVFFRSDCDAGQYGIEDNCTMCPEEMTSHSKTHVLKGCFKKASKPGVKASTIAIIVLSCALLISCVLVMILCLTAKHKPEEKGINVEKHIPMDELISEQSRLFRPCPDINIQSASDDSRSASDDSLHGNEDCSLTYYIRPRCQSMPAYNSIPEDPSEQDKQSNIICNSTESVYGKGTMKPKDISSFTALNIPGSYLSPSDGFGRLKTV